ncbi:MAG: hypothetical protein HOO95_07830 [Gallionella sp.]|nr:hypothetical protein [Gallionella sp.]
MTKNEIPEIAKILLEDLLDEPGSILYSGHATLKPNDVYLLGFNPGGAGGNPLRYSIDNMLTNESNAYLDESWENLNGTWGEGEAPLQKRICWLLENIGLDPREICTSNLIFMQSREANGINYNLAKRCWPVHEAILEIVKPKLIIAFGNSEVSPYGYMHSMLGGIEECLPSGHGSWSVKGFECNINGKLVYVAGLPHLSRYSPVGKNHVVEWLLNKFHL